MQGLPVTVYSTTILDGFEGWNKASRALVEQLAAEGAGVPKQFLVRAYGCPVVV
jgi:hypothetical protein